jgi:hypothetical protein
MEQRQVFSLLESLSKTMLSTLPRYEIPAQEGFVSMTALLTQAWQSVWEAVRDDVEDGVMDMIVEEPAEAVENRTARRADAVMVWKRIFFCVCV